MANGGRISTPLGALISVFDDSGALESLEFRGSTGTQDSRDRDRPHASALREQIGEYFAGERREFDLPLAPQGTEFERAVWKELSAIPWGSTTSYAEIARRLGKPGAVRAVGRANGKNPIPIIIPCHRVIGSDGSLTGYSGGLDRKRALLELEGRSVASQLDLFGPKPREGGEWLQ